MGDYERYSVKRKKEMSDVSDVLRYDLLPEPLRIQIFNLLEKLLWTRSSDEVTLHFKCEIIYNLFCHELGVFRISSDSKKATRDSETIVNDITNLVLHGDIEIVLDFLDFLFHELCIGNNRFVVACIADLNKRFLQNCVGYQIVDGRLVRIDSSYLYHEAVLPALNLIHEKQYDSVNSYYRDAHQHYRHSRYGECIGECLKCLESTMRIICDARGWQYDPNKATSRELIAKIIDNGLLPSWQQEQLNGLRITLLSGVPTVRNKLEGHGSGTAAVEAPEFYARYCLYLTAVDILLLVEANRAFN